MMDGKTTGKLMTRRAFVAGLGVAAGLLIWRPRVALADEPWWDGSYIFRGNGSLYGTQTWNDIGTLEAGDGGAIGGTMYTDRWVCAKTPWVEWDISAKQFIRTASKITIRCDFSTELYHHITGKLEIACGSYNGNDASYNLWHPDSGDDTRYTLVHRIHSQPPAEFIEGEHVVVIDNEVGDGLHRDGAQVWTDYRSYPGSDYSVWIRREQDQVLHSFQLKSSFWNYYYYGTQWYSKRSDDPPINFTTRWIDQNSERIMISCNLAWTNRVLTIAPASHPAKCLAVPQAQTSANVQCVLATNARFTSQQWIAEAIDQDSVRGTLRFIPVHLGNGSLSLDQKGSGPTMEPAACELWYTQSRNRAQSIWVHGDGSTQWLFSDCSGMALDRANGASADGTPVQFHSSGYPGNEWSNASHWWTLSDVRFGSESGKPLDIQVVGGSREIVAGTRLSVDSWAASLSPREKLSGASLSESGIVYEYDWIVSSETGAWLSEAPEIVGQAHPVGGNWMAQQPAAGVVGSVVSGIAVDQFRLSVEGTSLSGAINVNATGSGGIDKLSLAVTGDLGKRFSIQYRVFFEGYDWTSWASDGALLYNGGSKILGLQAVLRHRDVKNAASLSTVFTVDSSHKGKYIACVVRARTRYGSIPYRGSAVSNPVRVSEDKTQVKFYVDGEKDPCWGDAVQEGEPYRTPTSAQYAGEKEQCSGFECWFTDPECTTKYVQGTPAPKGQLNLYGRNMARITYLFTQATEEFFSGKTLFLDEEMMHPIDASTQLPEGQLVAWSTRIHAQARSNLWYEAHGKVRQATFVPGFYLAPDESSQLVDSVRITADTTLYLAWQPARYEGIEVS